MSEIPKSVNAGKHRHPTPSELLKRLRGECIVQESSAALHFLLLRGVRKGGPKTKWLGNNHIAGHGPDEDDLLDCVCHPGSDPGGSA